MFSKKNSTPKMYGDWRDEYKAAKKAPKPEPAPVPANLDQVVKACASSMGVARMVRKMNAKGYRLASQSIGHSSLYGDGATICIFERAA